MNANPAVVSGGAVAVEIINASGNAISTTAAPEIQLAARVIARRHCLTLPIARLMVGMGASGGRMAT